jgi:hypothetical protein
MPSLAGRIYVPKTYRIDGSRGTVVDLLADAVERSGARVLYNSFDEERVAPVYIGAEDSHGRRYGMLTYPFTATRRETRNRPADENRAQIRFGDPTREREADNAIARDVAGVDVTLVLAVDPEQEVFVGLDPRVYADLPMGISVFFKDENVRAVLDDGWSVWERHKKSGTRRALDVDVEAMVGFRPERLLDYVRFEARATAMGLDPGLRAAFASTFAAEDEGPHRLEDFFGLSSRTILDIVEANFRLGIAVRGGVAEHHLSRVLAADPAVVGVTPLDADGRPDAEVDLAGGRSVLVECKTCSGGDYANGDHKVEVQKTRDSGTGRRYTYEQFDVLAACLFPATGLWEFRYRWARDLAPWPDDRTRIKPMQRIDEEWAASMDQLLAQS